jgi:hypothetical protein
MKRGVKPTFNCCRRVREAWEPGKKRRPASRRMGQQLIIRARPHSHQRFGGVGHR